MSDAVTARLIDCGVDPASAQAAAAELRADADALVAHGWPVSAKTEVLATARAMVELGRIRGRWSVSYPRDRALPPLFSVVVPTHDRPEMARRAVDSVLAQTLTHLEVLVVDDGATPGTACWSDERVRLLRTTGSTGPGAARNLALDEASGAFIAFLDDDDLWTPDRLDLAIIGLTRAPVAVCWTQHIGSAARPGRRLDGHVGDALLESTTPCLGATAVSRSIVGRFDPHWHGIEDVVWWWALARRARVSTVPAVGYLVRLHSGERGRNAVDVRVSENLRFVGQNLRFFLGNRRALAHRLLRISLLARQAGRRPLALTAGATHLLLSPRLPDLVRTRTRGILGRGRRR